MKTQASSAASKRLGWPVDLKPWRIAAIHAIDIFNFLSGRSSMRIGTAYRSPPGGEIAEPTGNPVMFDNQRLTVYARSYATLGQKRYLLTNPVGLRMLNTCLISGRGHSV